MAQISRLHAQRIPVADARLECLCKLALKYDGIELAAAAVVSETTSIGDTLRKKLCLEIAQKILQKNKSIKPALEFLKRSELFQIEVRVTA
jgi:hypothetical protein